MRPCHPGFHLLLGGRNKNRDRSLFSGCRHDESIEPDHCCWCPHGPHILRRPHGLIFYLPPSGPNYFRCPVDLSSSATPWANYSQSPLPSLLLPPWAFPLPMPPWSGHYESLSGDRYIDTVSAGVLVCLFVGGGVRLSSLFLKNREFKRIAKSPCLKDEITF